ncbi:hypothetical protein FMM05_17045 [Flavobacterium zepuense]|uniref:Uncharacterized protein n=1 Tax=Flavobacterium zepuense TaxID=2593302 RepID=A0A552UWJ0_9FLAO|nr:hypothetical protein [Flavobacterium zepuense]TRW22586.1 hypothetical protein FMM05_17045 [Flavobacterium zepuense]
MIVIATVNSRRFKLNGIEYLKNYISTLHGNNIEIFNCYERGDVLVQSANYSDVKLNGVIYTSATALQAALLDVTYSRIMGSDSEFSEQDNIDIKKGFSFTGNLTNTIVANRVNNMPFFTVSDTQSVWVIANQYQVQTAQPGDFSGPILGYISIVKTFKYKIFNKGKGTYGVGGATTLTAADIELVYANDTTIQDIDTDAETDVIEYGVIAGQSIHEWLNAQTPALIVQPQNEGYTLFKGIINDVEITYLWVGIMGTYGSGALQSTANDFQELSQEQNATPYIPNLQEVTQQGALTAIPIIVNDITANTVNEYTAKAIKHKGANGRTLNIIPTEPTVNGVEAVLPQMAANDTFAMQGWVNGLTLTANQAAQEVYLKNTEGTTLATLNVGFLNNEGTTFSYNTSTGNLELKNDDGVLLSAIPVSSFVSNIVASAGFNATTPSLLEFKDSTNTVQFSVPYTINNIAGLQQALDALIIPDATETIKGKARIATQAETNTGTDDATIVTPKKMEVRVTSKINAITSDTVTQTANNRFLSVGPNLPAPDATTKLQYVTNPNPVPGTGDAYSFSPGLFLKPANGIPVSLTQNSRVFASADWVGDEFITGYGLLSPNDSFYSKVTNALGFNSVNNGINGSKIFNHYNGLYRTTNSELRFISLGTNDYASYGSNGAVPFANMMRGLLLSAYGTEATKGQAMTLSGTDWENDTLYGNTTTGVKTTVTGATATFTRNGSAIYVTIAYTGSGATAYSISIDGVNQGSFSSNAYEQFGGYPLPTASNYYAYTHRFAGLSNETHTITVTKTGSIGILKVIGSLSNNSLRPSFTFGGQSQYVFAPWRMNALGYSNYSGINDTVVESYKIALKATVYELANDGLNIEYWDTDAEASPNITSYSQANGIYRTSTAHTSITHYIINRLSVYNPKKNSYIDQLPSILASKANIGDFVNLDGSQTISGVKTFSTYLIANEIRGLSGSTANPVIGIGGNTIVFSKSSTNAGPIVNMSHPNTSGTQDLLNFNKGGLGLVGGVTYDGHFYGQPATALNHYITLRQLGTTITITGNVITPVIGNSKYIANGGTMLTIPLPLDTNANIGDFIEVRGRNTGGWRLSQPETATVVHGITNTTAGTAGSISSTAQYDSIRIEKIAPNEWVIVQSAGTLSIV